MEEEKEDKGKPYLTPKSLSKIIADTNFCFVEKQTILCNIRDLLLFQMFLVNYIF